MIRNLLSPSLWQNAWTKASYGQKGWPALIISRGIRISWWESMGEGHEANTQRDTETWSCCSTCLSFPLPPFNLVQDLNRQGVAPHIWSAPCFLKETSLTASSQAGPEVLSPKWLRNQASWDWQVTVHKAICKHERRGEFLTPWLTWTMVTLLLYSLGSVTFSCFIEIGLFSPTLSSHLPFFNPSHVPPTLELTASFPWYVLMYVCAHF